MTSSLTVFSVNRIQCGSHESGHKSPNYSTSTITRRVNVLNLLHIMQMDRIVVNFAWNEEDIESMLKPIDQYYTCVLYALS